MWLVDNIDCQVFCLWLVDNIEWQVSHEKLENNMVLKAAYAWLADNMDCQVFCV